MKLVKILSATTAIAILSACSSSNVSEKTKVAANEAANAANNVVTTVKDTAVGKVETTTSKLDTTSRTVVYSCQQKKTLTATYAFENGEVKAVNLKLGKKAINGLLVDPSNPDFVSFKSKTHLWNVDTNFSYENFDKATGGNLVKFGKQSDEILAKLCDINKKATAKLNK